MKIKRLFYVLLIGLFTIINAGCESGYSLLSEKEKEKSLDYIIYENAELSLPLTSFNSLNPLYMDNSTYFYFSKLIYEGLFEYDENLEPMPHLVSTYTILDSGKSIDLTLKEGILFHNGKTLTSKDVAFTIDMMKRAGGDTYFQKLNQAGLLPANQILSTKVISDSRLVITFKDSLAYILDILTFPIIPESKRDVALEVDDFIPIGSGPYKYVEHNKFKEIYLRANEDYREGEAEISHIVGKIFQDEESILTAFETGKLNIAKASGIDWDKYESNKRISIYEFVSNEYIGIGFNHSKEIFKDPKSLDLKRAILYCLDRQAIIEKVYLKHATQVDTPINPTSYLFSEESLTYGYNKDMAIGILDRAGYLDNNKNGLREDSLGNDLILSLLVTVNNNLELKALDMIKSYLKEVGIGLEVSFYNPLEENVPLEKEPLLGSDFDLLLLGWKQSIIPRYNYLLDSKMTTKSNYSFYMDERMDQALIDFDRAYDLDIKKEASKKLQKLIVEGLPYASLYFRNGALLVDNFIEGPLNPNYYNIYNGLEKCYIKMSIK